MQKINQFKQKIKTVSEKPGIYKVFDENNNIIYIGKAKNLKKRLSNYANNTKLTQRTNVMIEKAHDIETIVTENETQALILEACLIKEIQPKYNILLKDDKSYPYIAINKKHEYPKISQYKGKIPKIKNYINFGPFTSSKNTTQLISIVQKMFGIRVCNDHYFKSRKRPCLEYDTNRCSGPCVAIPTKEEYDKNIKKTINFLNGNISYVKEKIKTKMINASKNMQYELANEYKNMLTAIDDIYKQMSDTEIMPSLESADIIAIKSLFNILCIQIFFFRNSKNIGNQTFFSNYNNTENESNIIETFILQFYQNRIPAKTIYTNIDIENISMLQEALDIINNSMTKSTIQQEKNTQIIKTIKFIENNAEESLKEFIKKQEKNKNVLEILSKTMSINKQIELIEVIDNSHNFGTYPIGAIIAVTTNGFEKKLYRKFNLSNKSGNDYEMLVETIERRFTNNTNKLPDLLMIDGGPGHISVAQKTIEKIGIDIPLLGIAKGEKRNDGKENYYAKDRKKIPISNQELLYYLQILRDEAHRFAISSHTNKKYSEILLSSIDKVKGIGKIKKYKLLDHFGSIKKLLEVDIKEIMDIASINEEIAKNLIKFLQNDKTNN